MDNTGSTLHSKVHTWIEGFGFHFNGSHTDNKSNVTTNHYFFETFNVVENAKNDDLVHAKFLCFDAYGETIKVKTLLDLQTAFFENISQLK